MSASFTELHRYKQLGLSYSAVLVLSYLQERGASPIGKIADAVGCSTRCVEMALAAIKRLGLFSGQTPKNFSHDHDQHGHEIKGTTKPFSEAPEESFDVSAPAAPSDPLMKRLCDFDVLPWCAEAIVSKIERGELQRVDVERQLAHHRVRLDAGFKFKSHPARFLFTAILKNFAPPAGVQSKAMTASENGRAELDFGATTLERRAEFEARQREQEDEVLRRRSLLAMFANQCRPERGPRRKTPEQLQPALEKNGLSLVELRAAIAACGAARAV